MKIISLHGKHFPWQSVSFPYADRNAGKRLMRMIGYLNRYLRTNSIVLFWQLPNVSHSREFRMKASSERRRLFSAFFTLLSKSWLASRLSFDVLLGWTLTFRLSSELWLVILNLMMSSFCRIMSRMSTICLGQILRFYQNTVVCMGLWYDLFYLYSYSFKCINSVISF